MSSLFLSKIIIGFFKLFSISSYIVFFFLVSASLFDNDFSYDLFFSSIKYPSSSFIILYYFFKLSSLYVYTSLKFFPIVGLGFHLVALYIFALFLFVIVCNNQIIYFSVFYRYSFFCLGVTWVLNLHVKVYLNEGISLKILSR